MMGKRFTRIVEECLHRLDRGENLPDVLTDYPVEAERLKPLLLIAMASRSMAVPLPDSAAYTNGRTHMLAEMDRVASGPGEPEDPILVRGTKRIAKLAHASRARGLIRPSPNYRLAMIALVALFGSGWFVLSASASPGELFRAISEDFQQVLAFLYRDPSDAPPDYFQLISITTSGNSPRIINGASKAVFLRDLLDVNASPVRANHPPTTHSNTPSPDQEDQDSSVNPLPSEIVPDPTSLDIADDDQGPGDLPVPSPHPASFVNEVVSDTAKEKNPVWDQLPFNQSDEDDADEQEGEDQTADEEEEDSNPGPPSWVFDDDDDDD